MTRRGALSRCGRAAHLDGIVHGLVREIDEEGLVVVLGVELGHVLDRLARVQVRRVRRAVVVFRDLAVLPQVVALPDDLLHLVADREGLRDGEVPRVRAAARVNAVVVVEPALQRQVGLLVHAQVPLADRDGRVARRLQLRREELLVERHAARLGRVHDRILHAVPDVIPARHEHRPRRRARRLRVKLLEEDAGLRERLHLGRVHRLVVPADVAVAHVVHQHQHDVRPRDRARQRLGQPDRLRGRRVAHAVRAPGERRERERAPKAAHLF